MPSRADHATSVVVSTYNENRWDELEACLRSLDEQTAPPLETLVVVDHNPPLLERVAASHPRVKTIANQRSRGLAGARNTGIDNARGELIAFIDDDARAEPQWLERLAGCVTDSDTAGVGGALIPRWEGPEPTWFPHEFLWVVGCSYTGLPETLAPVRNPIGANMAVRASVLREIGGFREGGGEDAPREIRSRGVVRAGGNIPDDTDLAIRVSQRHQSAIWLYEPCARVHHTVTPERASLGYFVRRCYEEGVGKAGLSAYVGSRDGLSSERRYLVVAIPRGIAAGAIGQLRGEQGGLARAAAILVGMACSAAGFLAATLGRALKRHRHGG